MSETNQHPPVEHLLRLERLLKAASWRRTADEFWISPNLLRLFGIESGSNEENGRDVFHNQLAPLFHPDDVERVTRFVESLGATAGSEIEFRVQIDDRERIFVAIAENEDGVRTGMVHDVTTEREVEHQKSLAESRFEALAAELPAGIYLGTVTGEPRYANRTLLSILGVESHEDIAWEEIIHPDDASQVQEGMKRFVERGSLERFLFRATIADEIRTLECRHAFVPDTDQQMIVSSIIDQTETNARQRQLMESERQLDWSQRISKTATWRLDSESNEITWSDELYRMLGRDPETFQVTDTTFFEHVAEEYRDQTTELLENAVATGEPWDYEVRLIADDGRRVWARSIGEVVLDQRGNVTGLRGVVQDISELSALHEQVRRAEKFQALGELAGGIAHDFNNMLAAILGNAELLQTDLTGEAELDCREIIETARRCGDLTNQLLAFSSRRPLQSREVDIAQSVETVLGLVQHATDAPIDVTSNLPGNPPLISGETSQIENALLNVCVNASQAMPDGGNLTIDVEHTFLSPENWGDEFDIVAGPAIAIRVTDTGVGIRAENLVRVLDPFFSTRRESGGTGLGLATTFGVVRNHGGGMRIESELGRGTSVTIVLPASTPDSLIESDDIRAESLELTGLSVLVVDDELAVRRVVSRHLESLGASPDSAGGHREAVELIETRSAADDAYDIGIFDLSMPDGKGTETAARFSEAWPFSAVLIISGFDVHTALEQSPKQHQVLQKPFTREGLARAINEALERT